VTTDTKTLDTGMAKKKNAWGLRKSNKKSVAPYQKYEQKTTQKEKRVR
jgi:hypothetical protein